MSFGTSNRVALRMVEESTWGTTPATPALEAIRFTSESLNYNADFTTSEEIRSDRMTPDTVQVSASSGGDINGEWSYGTYDDFIAAACFSDWVTTGSDISAASDIGITKTAGTPNTWALTSSTTDLSAQSWTVGQFIAVSGFTGVNTIYAEIVGTPTANSVAIAPLADVATIAAGDSVDIVALEFVRNGVTKRSFTIQKAFTDLDTPEYQNFPGARIGGFQADMSTGSILGVTFPILAKDSAMTETQFAGATFVPATTTTVLNAVNNVAAISFDGDPAGSQYYFTSMSFNLDNRLRGQEAIGTLGFIGVEGSRIDLTGSMELYFENSDLFDRFRATTAFSLSFMVADAAGNLYIVTLPRVKFSNMEIVAGGLDQDIFASSEFTAIINTAGTYQFQVSRLAAA